MRGLTSLLTADQQHTDEAVRRAEELLRDSLSPERYAAYRAHGYIEVASRLHPGRVYRVDGWRPVGVYEQGRFVGAVCIRARESLPAADVLLARKLMIEGAEDEFLRAGNWLQPAWRPAGAAPTIALLLALLAPYVLHLRTLGPLGVLGGVMLGTMPLLIVWFRRRRSSA